MGVEEERRTAQRSEAIVVVELDEEGRIGVTRDVSERGLLIGTRYKFKVGDRLELTLHSTSGPVQSKGRVVRVEETPPIESWRYKVAVELDDTLPENVVEDGMRAAATLLGRSEPPPPAPPNEPPKEPPNE